MARADAGNIGSGDADEKNKVSSIREEEAGNARARRKVLYPPAESQEAGANDANAGSREEDRGGPAADPLGKMRVYL